MLWLVAAAAAAELDVLVLTTGERVEGELIDLRDGQYWVILPDMKVRSYKLQDVVRVEVGGAAPVVSTPAPDAELPVPSWQTGRNIPHYDRKMAVGFDFGSSMAVRLRFRTQTRALAHVDLSLGEHLQLFPGFGFGSLLQAEAAFFGGANVHPTVLASTGLTFMWGDFYYSLTGGLGLQVDPDGPFELHLGFQMGILDEEVTLVPDISGTWVW